MKLSTAILLALIATPAIAGSAGGWGNGSGWQPPPYDWRAAQRAWTVKKIAPPPKDWKEPAFPPAPPLRPLSQIFEPNWYVSKYTRPPNGVDRLVSGIKFNKAGWMDAEWGPLDPPAQYDHPFNGDLTIIIASMAHVKEMCPPFQPGVPPVGCSTQDSKPATWCRITIAREEDTKAVGWDFKTILRHERAHCNGWPADHPGARRAPPPQM
jgi:hypothetical protein